MTDKLEYLRSVWEDVQITNFYDGTRCCVEAWTIWLPCKWVSRVGSTRDDDVMLSDAVAFTNERLEAIRTAKRCIELIVGSLEGLWSVEQAKCGAYEGHQTGGNQVKATAEQQVKEKYPLAKSILGLEGWGIISRKDFPFTVLVPFSFERETAAWADALRRITAGK